jgi:hypothetical protein
VRAFYCILRYSPLGTRFNGARRKT